MKKLSTAVFLLFSWQCILADSCHKITPPECNIQDISYHPHQECTLFYRCDNGKMDVFSCPLEERFSPEYYICLPEKQVDCTNYCKEESMFERLGQFFNKLIDKLNEKFYGADISIISDTEDARAECEIPTCSIFEWGVTKPYPPDCTMYVSCNAAGNVEILPCPEGEHFSPTAFKCMDPDLAECPECGEVEDTTSPTSQQTETTTPEA